MPDNANGVKDMDKETKRFMAVQVVLAIAATIAFLLIVFTDAMAHEATNTAGEPLGWKFPLECCGQKDCAPIPASTVKERPNGYHVTLAPGQHPMLKTRGYSGVVPYSAARPSPSGDYHICLAPEGAHRFCFFAGDKGS